MSDNPYNITTDAGQRLWTYLNNQHGAGTWGLAGDLIPLIEEQVSEAERERIVKKLESYFELTRFSIEAEGADENPQWDAGFGAALALIEGDKDA
jgi:hypothetical protein